MLTEKKGKKTSGYATEESWASSLETVIHTYYCLLLKKRHKFSLLTTLYQKFLVMLLVTLLYYFTIHPTSQKNEGGKTFFASSQNLKQLIRTSTLVTV